MTKQKEIRGYLENLLLQTRSYCHPSAAPKLSRWDIDKILNYLHSRGVVIKVDKELPTNNYDNWSLASNELEGRTPRQVLHLRYWAYDMAQRDMLNVGYVAVEPLIEDEDEKVTSSK